MPYPTELDIAYSYTGWGTSHPGFPFPGTQLDNDLANIELSVDSIDDFIRATFTSEGYVATGRVRLDSLAQEVRDYLNDQKLIADGFDGRPFFFVEESQSNGLFGQYGSNYSWPPNLRIWGWDGAVHSDTFIASDFFTPDANTQARPGYIAAAQFARKHPKSLVYLASFAKGAQYLAQWALVYPAANGPPLMTPGGPIVGGGFVDGNGIPYWNMRKIRDQNMPAALAKAGMSEIDGYFMIQAENEAFQGKPALAFLQENNLHHGVLRQYSWFPWTTPFIRSMIGPYQVSLDPYNRPLQLWCMRDNCRQFVQLDQLPSSFWEATHIHFDGRGGEYAGRLWAAAFEGKPASRTKRSRLFTPVAFGSNVTSVAQGFSLYDFDAQNYEDGGSAYCTPVGAGVTQFDIPFAFGLPLANQTFFGTALAYNTGTAVAAPCALVMVDTTKVRAIFTATSANQHIISWNGRGFLAA